MSQPKLALLIDKRAVAIMGGSLGSVTTINVTLNQKDKENVKISIEAGGLRDRDGVRELCTWVRDWLKIGSTVEIRVVEDEPETEPVELRHDADDVVEKAEYDYYLRMKAKYEK